MKSNWLSAFVGLPIVLLALGLFTVPAQAGQPAPSGQSSRSASDSCGWRGEEVVHALGVIVKERAAVHNGPAAKCPVTRHLAHNRGVEIYCEHVNNSGNLWYYTTTGWIYSPYVKVTKVAVPLGYIPAC
ncbi:hypothetical protein LUW75_11130 [Streptomyces sp. MRC013]|uniref:hypothetical protein n=1 Tax=Streptomyces sp. MRC013 TaxID=2898276 RepID=UPI0020274B69|nr:hypothetical protein [Streptomyces sp. MRC013]URM90462.1 hypothetical protein LUW75_11130 [Streptomyces sp. MRC013]